MTRSCQIVIIGAGPYGLSLAAHLRARGIDFRIFGHAMESWRAHMPAGMNLKSDGFASDLYDCERNFTLQRFCAQHQLPYGEVGVPVPLETMVAYGLDFQARLVPNLEERTVTYLDRGDDGYRLRLDDGETLNASHIVVAVGQRHFRHIPESLAYLPQKFVSHSSDHSDIDWLSDREVIIVGGGASALDIAALCQETGSRVRVLVRKAGLRFTSKPEPRTLWKRVRSPMSGLGGGWDNLFFAKAPGLFRYFPSQLRSHLSSTILGPAGGWSVRKRILGRVPILAGHSLLRAEVRDTKIWLQVQSAKGQVELAADHVIAATGYRVDLRRLDFLSDKLRSSIRTTSNAPALSPNFQSSAPGLYFLGIAALQSFGPVMRFLYGAGYSADRVSAHIARDAVTAGLEQVPSISFGESHEPPPA